MFQKGHKKFGGRKKRTLNKTTSLKRLVQERLDCNKDKAIKMLDAMFDNKYDFKWFMQLKASLEPKELKGEGFENKNITVIFGNGKPNDTNTLHTTLGAREVPSEPGKV